MRRIMLASWWMALAGGILLAATVFAEDIPGVSGVDLAVQGRCAEAMPLLDRAMRDPAIAEGEKRKVSTAGVRCSMLLNRQNDAMSFLGWLQQHFPGDSDVLFLSVHVYSELSDRNAEELMRTAPDSPLVIELNAESFEKQHDLARAIAEYRILLERAPDRPGIHYRIGGLLMLQSSGASSMADARKEFEAELRLNPQNASAEFYLGELEAQQNHPAQAVAHYRRATGIYPGFADAYGKLGRALLDSGATAEAIPALEKSVALAPANPAFHLALATAYRRSGREPDAAREFALQKSTAETINRNAKELRQTVSGSPKAESARP